jgi:ELWxxDGT repeat protein
VVATGFRYPGPNWLVNAAGTLFFTANNGTSGAELWRSDGTSAGTRVASDIAAGFAGSDPANLVAAGGTVYFTADDGVSGRELWKSDGTAAGTVLVRDIAPGLDGSGKPVSSSPGDLRWGGGALWFTADTGSGRELWKSDGTAAGTVLVRDIAPGSAGSMPSNLAWGGGALWFTADDGTSGAELWRSDGTPAGTALVRDLFPGAAGSAPEELAWGGGALWFTADDGASGRELWRSDGTTAGTELVRDLFPGAGGSSPEGLLWGGGMLWFTADDGASGRELWKTDGAAATLVKDIRPGAASSVPQGSALMAWAGGYLALMADDGANGRELWTSDGTAAGTVLAGEVAPGPRGGDPAWLAAAGNRVLFSADDGTRGREPWFYSPNAAPVDIAVSPPAVPENRPAGTLVGILSAIDPDFGDSFSYALVSGAGDTGNALFAISGTSLLTAAAFDFESRPAHGVRVRVTDRGGLSFEKALSISVTDVDEGPSIRPVPAVPVIANLAVPIGGLSVSDPMAGAARLTTTLSAGAGLLTIGARTGLVFLAGDGVSDATIRFTGTLAQTNAALGSLSHITAIDTLAATGISVQVQRGGFAAQVTVPMVVATGRVTRISDPGLAGKLSIVVQGTESADKLLVTAIGTSTSSYTVNLNGVSTTLTGITGRIIAFGLGGDDDMDLSGARVSVRADGGEGNDGILGGRLADTLFGGNGADLIAGGLGADGINGGAGNDIVIDGTVSVRAAGKTLRSVLNGWAAKASPAESDYASITTDLLFTADKASKDTLTGGLGTDWFWSATAGAVADVTDKSVVEKRRLV